MNIMAGELRELIPRARSGLLTSEHEKRGHRFITIMDVKTEQVALLEDWEYAVLVLCDGARTENEIIELMSTAGSEAPINKATIRRCLKFFESKALIEPLGLLRTQTVLDSPKTMGELQVAYEEWHKEPVATGQFPQWLAPWSGDEPEPPPASMEPTKTRVPIGGRTPVHVGSTLNLEAAESLLFNASVPVEAIGEEATDSPGMFKPNTQANEILSALSVDQVEPEKASENILFVLDEAVSEMGIDDEDEPVSWEHEEATDAYDEVADDSAEDLPQVLVSTPIDENRATVQVHAYSASKRQVVTNEERLATVTTRPNAEDTSVVFRRWVMMTRQGFEQQGRVPLSAFMSGMPTKQVSVFISHLKTISEHLQNPDSIHEFLELIIACLNGRPARMRDGHSADVSVLFAEVLRQAKADGVCPACMKKQSLRCLRCIACGFTPSLARQSRS